MHPKIEKIQRAKKLIQLLQNPCNLCPRNCDVLRNNNQTGYCGTENTTVIYSYFLHQGEEPVLSGKYGSGTIFFSGCNLRCIFCQNHLFSQTTPIQGKKTSAEALAKIMLQLQEQKAHNINLVTPTHFLPNILQALESAYKQGLSIPIVYNTSGYEKTEIIELLDGIVDIYLPDFKYLTKHTANAYSHAPDYPKRVKAVLRIMENQTGKPEIENGIMKKGVIIRHLVLPGNQRESIAVVAWIKNNCKKSLISVMSQYQPYHLAKTTLQLAQPLKPTEYLQVANFAQKMALEGWIQEDPEECLSGIYFKPQA